MNMNQYLNKLVCGNNLKITSTWPSNYFDSVLTDPPYELGFMGKSWDSSGIAYSVPLWKQLLRVSKPGAFLLCFGGTRTYHRVVCAIEDAGWEIRDCMMWLYGSGFPKSHNISKAIDKSKGKHKPELVATKKGNRKLDKGEQSMTFSTDTHAGYTDISKPVTDLAQLWDGYGTALKPAWEPIIVAMKPLDGTFAHNAEAHGVAGLNIDGSRISLKGEKQPSGSAKRIYKNNQFTTEKIYGDNTTTPPQGRWPANLILDEEAGAMLDEQTGNRPAGGKVKGHEPSRTGQSGIYGDWGRVENTPFKDKGGASRFFYCAKAAKKERNLGCEELEEKQYSHDGRDKPIENAYQRNDSKATNNHPTVKPLTLIKYLCTLLKMPSASQVILDPFMGSGTTGMACKSLGINFIGIDQNLDYCHIARKRIDATTMEEK